MLNSQALSVLVDVPVSREVFPNVEVKGGVCYFLWSKEHRGNCEVTLVRGEEKKVSIRRLDEFDVFVRDPVSAEILRKVLAQGEPSINQILTADTPFGISTNFTEYRETRSEGSVVLHYFQNGKRGVGYVPRDLVSKNSQLIDMWKVLVPEAGSDGGQKIPDSVLGKSLISIPPSICTQTFLAFYLQSESDARSLASYYCTKFFRHLVSLRKLTQHALRSTYSWVPIQAWDRHWTDEMLYEKYGLSISEIEHIEAMIRPMDTGYSAND
jgi:site-specific DNA-methyltransferase (adenine-specific)